MSEWDNEEESLHVRFIVVATHLSKIQFNNKGQYSTSATVRNCHVNIRLLPEYT